MCIRDSYRNFRDFGKTTNFVEKNAFENGSFFFTYERCRGRLPLIKMINEGEEVFVQKVFEIQQAKPVKKKSVQKLQ